jgi:hypothetical protein
MAGVEMRLARRRLNHLARPVAIQMWLGTRQLDHRPARVGDVDPGLFGRRRDRPVVCGS